MLSESGTMEHRI